MATLKEVGDLLEHSKELEDVMSRLGKPKNVPNKEVDLLELMVQAIDGIIECPECGASIEPDAHECLCGWVNPLIEAGMI